ncbi:putative protein phosphatase inhibitor 2 [Elsinoe australis]|uniref:Protein GLC8 n=1 Tax=Elsinoe australis TaxID=40998 RepID=A0A2P7YL82_9PEZI|nr:Protein GLC8 [Elsinoe australis]TKX26771.1 putative protein phosphatase inhibitor 2 [Elsinoe australis]
MSPTPAPDMSPTSGERKPKGILKNSGQHVSPELRTSPTEEAPAPRPELNRELSEKEIVQMNTNINAGGHRRNSSNPRGSISRRQSGAEGPEAVSPRLRWDEANLYLNEGQMGGKMKIDEPKTPYAGRYDPEDEDEDMPAIDPSEVAVDELDMAKSKKGKQPKTDQIPGLDLGEPEMDTMERPGSEGERRVILDPDHMDVDGARHGEVPNDMPPEEREKHRKFEDMRKKHYEMKNVKNLLGHSEDDDEEK